MRRTIYSFLIKVLPIVFICTTLVFLNFKFLTFYHYFPNIAGFDAPSHFAMIQVIRESIFPSLWGWVQQWYAGMPMPLFYPPLPYYIASLFIDSTSYQSMLVYKIISEIFILLNIILLFILLKKEFGSELDERRSRLKGQAGRNFTPLSTLRLYAPIILAIITIVDFNTGAPGIGGLSDGIFSHQLAMVWFIASVWLFWKRTTKNLIYGSVAISLLLLSNVHAFLTLCLFLPFLILLTYRGTKKINLIKTIHKSLYFFIIGIGISACWFLPMLYFYEYFAGIYIIDFDVNNRFLTKCWSILLVLIPALILTWKNKNRLFNFYLAISILFILLFGIEITQRTNLSIHLPVQLWRWYETAFVLIAFPLAHVLFIVMKKYKHIGVLVLLLLFLNSFNREVYPVVYPEYRTDDVPKLIEYMKPFTNGDLVLVSGRWFTPSAYKQVVIDAELGIQGVHTAFSNIRESSINSLFLRIAKLMVSPQQEDWALINFVQNQSSNKHIDNQYPLLHFLGINHIIVPNEDIDGKDDFISTKNSLMYSTSSPTHAFTVLHSKSPQSRATEIKAPLTLIFAEQGFRDRTITDQTYSRFQEIAFEKQLYRKTIAFLPKTLVIEDNVEEIMRSKYIVLSTLETKNIEKAIDTIALALQHPDRKVFILGNKRNKDLYKIFVERFARHNQVIFVDIRNNIFPYDEVVSTIIKSEKIDLYEKPLQVDISSNTVFIAAPGTSNKKIPALTSTQDLSQTIWFMRQSHFPAWEAVAQNSSHPKIYLASPAYNLIFPEQNTSISLYFKTPAIVVIAHIVSLFALLTLLITSLVLYRKENSKPVITGSSL